MASFVSYKCASLPARGSVGLVASCQVEPLVAFVASDGAVHIVDDEVRLPRLDNCEATQGLFRRALWQLIGRLSPAAASGPARSSGARERRHLP
jgi:hypothetical protein